jgi:phosphoesterase RecJ-like protein
MRDAAPHAYKQLPGADLIRVTPTVDREYDGVFVIECSDIDRPGLIDLEKQFVVNIDHHTSTVLFGTINWIDSTASAVGEMIYNLCKATGVRPTVEIAECVYTALLTDTGSFHYSNTSERTFKIASELVRTGVRPAKTAEAIYGNYQWPKIELLGQVLATAKRDESGRIAWMRQTLEMQERTSACEEDTDGFVNLPADRRRRLRGCAVQRMRARRVPHRVSARKAKSTSPKSPNASAAAAIATPPGCTLKGTWDEIENQVVPLTAGCG